MKILFASVECYPAAKVGGLADVVGAVPKYINKQKNHVCVVMPKYNLAWINEQHTEIIKEGEIQILDRTLYYSVETLKKEVLGFEILFVHIPELFYREGVYADSASNYFIDEAERFTSFAKVFLEILRLPKYVPDLVHCHDHHTSLIPFIMRYGKAYSDFKNIPTVLTIHNEKYRGRFTWQKSYLLPEFDNKHGGLLDWDHMIDPLSCGVKCAWAVTTVSPSYMTELLEEPSALQPLFQQEKEKTIGLLNGIDTDYWNPEMDTMITHTYKRSLDAFKKKNKEALCKEMNLSTKLPLFSFIGRLALEKGADHLPDMVKDLFQQSEQINIIILGTGMASLEKDLHRIGKTFKNCTIKIMYNEAMAHRIYAGTDFLLMPSRVEPCGLNQMYAMRYGTIPIVRSVGGLKDTVKDIRYRTGTGIRYKGDDSKSLVNAVRRGLELYKNQEKFESVRKNAFEQDFSWDKSAKNYIRLYKELLKKK